MNYLTNTLLKDSQPKPFSFPKLAQPVVELPPTLAATYQKANKGSCDKLVSHLTTVTTLRDDAEKTFPITVATNVRNLYNSALSNIEAYLPDDERSQIQIVQTLSDAILLSAHIMHSMTNVAESLGVDDGGEIILDVFGHAADSVNESLKEAWDEINT